MESINNQQINRISSYEKIMDEVTLILNDYSEDKFPVLTECIRKIEAYYTSTEWKEDFEADEAGLLPKDLKRGVLSEDGISDILDRFKEISNPLMTQYERMEAGLLYDPGDKKIVDEQVQYLDKLWEFNKLKPSQFELKQKFLKEMFAECGEDVFVELPLNSNWGGHHVHFGNRVYANTNLTLVDDGHIFVGDAVMFGPNVTVATAAHPVDADLRYKGYQFNKDVHIEDNVWIGAGVIILPGVTIGKNSVIGAGSVVTKDIPANVVAVGNPCKVLREIGDRDKEYFYKNEKVDL